MGQKTNPIGNRLGIIRGWDSNWYGGRNYGDKLAEDEKIRKYVHARLAKASVSNVIIERTLKLITITITTARPGIIIGKAGQEVDKLKEELKKITNKDIQINIFEIKRPELDAQLAEQAAGADKILAAARDAAMADLKSAAAELVGDVMQAIGTDKAADGDVAKALDKVAAE